jgi:hypothetical protein
MSKDYVERLRAKTMCKDYVQHLIIAWGHSYPWVTTDFQVELSLSCGISWMSISELYRHASNNK